MLRCVLAVSLFAFCLAASACGSVAPAASAPAAQAPAAGSSATSAQPAAATAPPSSTGLAGAPQRLEKTHLDVAVAAAGGTSTPEFVAHDAGYFSSHGLDVTISVVSASAATEGLISGQIDIYQGGAAAIAGHLGGADLIYAAAPIDRSSLKLLGQKGITTVEGLAGKAVATTSPGAFGEIAMRKTAKGHGLEVGKDIKLLFHPNPPAALSTFLSGNAAGLIITPPESIEAQQRGYPVIVDYYQQG